MICNSWTVLHNRRQICPIFGSCLENDRVSDILQRSADLRIVIIESWLIELDTGYESNPSLQRSGNENTVSELQRRGHVKVKTNQSVNESQTNLQRAKALIFVDTLQKFKFSP